MRNLLKKCPQPFLTMFACLLVVAIGGLDVIADYDVSVSFLYLFPVVLIAWFEGCASATVISIFSAVSWAVADLASGRIYAHFGIAVWDAVMVLALFLIVAYFIMLLKRLLIRERGQENGDHQTK